MIEILWYSVVAGACLIALANWRAGIYAGIVLDCLRDPVRKISEDQSVAITLAGIVVWGFIAFQVLQQERTSIRRLLQEFPRLRAAITCVVLALIPSAVLSCVLYPRGYLLVVIGGVSYLFPFVGLAIGYVFARSEEDLYRLFSFYSLTNSLVLIGVPLEYLDFDVAGLGGIDFEWIRYRTGYTVDLISGFYRSPDIMGLHAAHVAMFSILLALRSRGGGRIGWMGIAVWAGYCILLCGRRKMIGIPFVFMAVYMGLCMFRNVRHLNSRLVQAALFGGFLGAAVFVFVWDWEEGSEYTQYASTIVTEGAQRSNEIVIRSSIGTLKQIGIMGAGLGTATQGRYYLGIRLSSKWRAWQEDGVSRLLMEFGLPGLVLLGVAAIFLSQMVFQALRLVPRSHSIQALQIGLAAVVFGNAASFIISHQQFSGDPVNALMVTIMAGAAFGCPRLYADVTNRQVGWVDPRLTPAPIAGVPPVGRPT